MRELILKMSMTLDGFVAGPNGEAEWVFGADEEARAWAVEKVWNASLHIMGSRSFQAMAPYWPTSTMAFAPPMNQIPKAVFSKQGPAILNAAPTTRERRARWTGPATPQSGNFKSARKAGRRRTWPAATWPRKSPD